MGRLFGRRPGRSPGGPRAVYDLPGAACPLLKSSTTLFLAILGAGVWRCYGPANFRVVFRHRASCNAAGAGAEDCFPGQHAGGLGGFAGMAVADGFSWSGGRGISSWSASARTCSTASSRAAAGSVTVPRPWLPMQLLGWY